MTLRLNTIDNSLKYIAKSEQTRERDIKPIKNDSLPRKQNKKLSQNNKKIITKISASF